jgi:outer membrane protein OmpA-like peptidoglycan-associated protein
MANLILKSVNIVFSRKTGLCLIPGLFVLLVLAPPFALGKDYFLMCGGGPGLSTRNSGIPPWFTLGPELRFKIGVDLDKDWQMELGYYKYRYYDDLSAGSEFELSSQKENRTRALRGYDLGLLFKRQWKPVGNRITLSAGPGIGLSNWKITSPDNEITMVTSSERGGSVDYSATEIFLAGSGGIDYCLNDRWSIGFDLQANYLTGIGLEFDHSVEDSLGNWGFRAGITLNYMLGGKPNRRRDNYDFPSPVSSRQISVRAAPKTEPADVPKSKNFLNDSDYDGVPDGLDDCPDSPANAVGLIDIRGCPIDSDADGFPDYIDSCPHNPIGAIVDNSGCPLDSDSDGVPDGVDDCPETRAGSIVDKRGCIDISVLKSPTVLNIRYRSNSFEIDPRVKSKLDSIAAILKQAPVLKVKINGYTDNTGAGSENRALSQRRANRVRDYLVICGIDAERLIPKGKGAVDFIASNSNESGRQLNRRVELIFFR